MRKNNSCLIIFLLIVMSLSCSTPKELAREREIWDFKNWEQHYKDRAFCLCLLKGFDNQKVENTLMTYDNSFYNALGIAIFDESLNLIIENEVQKIKLDSINSLGSYPDDLKSIYQKRKVTKHCLNFYNSDQLDRYTNDQKPKWKKIPNIMDKIHEKIPSY